LLLGPIALLIVFSDALRRRFVYWRVGRDRNAAGRRPGGFRREASTVHFTDSPRERPARSLGARLALVSDVRRRGPAARLLRAASSEMAEELHDALVNNLRLCRSSAAVSAVLDDLNAKGLCGERQLAAALNRLVELETGEANVKRALAYGGLAVCRERNVSRRVIALKFDPISGQMEWRHRAVRSLEFSLVGPARIRRRLREPKRLRVAVHLDDAGQMVGWDMPPAAP
jgi:hypothetical protein